MAGAASSFAYDVFLSFRGEDTRFGFTGNLYKALQNRGIRTFIDDVDLPRGDSITPSLASAIENSRTAVIVFSKNYASSSFCLDELVNIIASIKDRGRCVMPVFYDVDPSDVRHQRGSYEEALALHEERFKDDTDKLQNWRMALRQAADLSGYHFKLGDGYEYMFIDRIIQEVSIKINRAPLHVADYPVGLESRVLQVMELLDVGSDGVHMVGIHGMGGIGKTTLARAVYNLISDHYHSLCFLEDVRENSNKYGIKYLQEMLLSKLVGEKDITFTSVNEGISIIKQRLQRKKILLILDDVDALKQLHDMVGGPDWFGPGSRVIITTRYKHLLALHEVEKIYEAYGLNKTEALELFRRNAFKNNAVHASFEDITNRAVTYASGLPLALEVIGSYLFGKNIEEWKSALDGYERIPNEDIQKILELSFDALKEEEKIVFLDIACCYKGYQLREVEDILRAHHDKCMKHHIGELVEKSLIKISKDGKVTLHDLIEDMGKEIVRQESPKEPWKRSRLWFHEDIIRVLEDNMGTSNIEIICLRRPILVTWDGEAFKKMTNLKTLIIRNGCFLEAPKQLPKSLRVLEWRRFPSRCLPSNFDPRKLAILRLPESSLMSLEFPKLPKKFINIRVLNFGKCKNITEIPDVSGLPNLEEISLRFCVNLIKIHESVGFLGKLRILNAFGCSKLKSFPPIKLTSLEVIKLSYCSSLESFPEILGEMENITNLYLRGTPIKKLPYSIRNLTRLQRIQLYGLNHVELPSSIVLLRELEQLSVQKCVGLQLYKQDEGEETVSSNVERLDLKKIKISDEFLRIGLSWFANMKELDLSFEKNFTILPESIKECRFLWKLNLNGCGLLQEIRGVPPNIELFYAKKCTSLKELDLTLLPACTKECRFLRVLKLDNCENLQEIRGIPPNLEILSARNCTSLTSLCRSMLMNEELHEGGCKKLYLPGTRIPEWFEHRSKGRPISFWFRNKIPAICLSVVTGKVNKHFLPIGFRPKLIINYKKEFLLDSIYPFEDDHILIFGEEQIKFEDGLHEILENKWNHAVFSIDIIKMNPTDLISLETGFHVFKQKSSMEDIRFNYPLINVDRVTLQPINHLFLKEKQRLVDKEVCQTQQQNLASFSLLEPHVRQDRESLLLLPPPAMKSLKDNVNWDSNSMVSMLIFSPTSVQGLPEQYLPSTSKQKFESCGTVTEAKGKGMVECNSNDGEDNGWSPVMNLLPMTKGDQVTSEKSQPSSSIVWDPIHWNINNQEDQFVSNDKSSMSDERPHVIGSESNQRSGKWLFCLCDLIPIIASLCSSSSSLTAP